MRSRHGKPSTNRREPVSSWTQRHLGSIPVSRTSSIAGQSTYLAVLGISRAIYA